MLDNHDGKDVQAVHDMHDCTCVTMLRENKGDLYKQLNYEAVKEQAGMDDSELVYVSFSNQALAHLPYMVALDTASR